MRGITARAALNDGSFLCFVGQPRSRDSGMDFFGVSILIRGMTKSGHEKKAKYGQI
jgi:hypothetical protein